MKRLEGGREAPTLAQLAEENEALRREIALLQRENASLRQLADGVRDLLARCGTEHSAVEAELRDRRLEIAFDPAHVEAVLSYGGRRGSVRGQLFWLLRHAALCAAGDLEVEDAAARPVFHWAWACYLFATDAPSLGGFRRVATELNQAVAAVLAGDRHNRAAYLVAATGWRSGTYVVRLGGPDLPAFTSNLAGVDLLLAPGSARDPNAVSQELARCERAAAAVERRFRGDALALAAASQIRDMAARLRAAAGAGRDPWVEEVARLTSAVQQLRDCWTVETTGPAGATLRRSRPDGGEVEVLPRGERLSQPDPGAAPALAALRQSLERSVLAPLAREASLPRAAWTASGDAALFQAARQARPAQWQSPRQVRDSFTAALCAHLARDPALDRVQPRLRERLARLLWSKSHPGSPPPEPAALFSWIAALTAPEAGVLAQPDTLRALRDDWEANRRRYRK